MHTANTVVPLQDSCLDVWNYGVSYVLGFRSIDGADLMFLFFWKNSMFSQMVCLYPVVVVG